MKAAARSLAWAVLAGAAGWMHPAVRAQTVVQALDAPSSSPAAVPTAGISWERVPGCARSIAAGAFGQVMVTGCEPRASAVRDLFRYDGASAAPGRFVPVPGQASAVAIGGPGSQGVWAIGLQGQVFASTGDVFNVTAAGAPMRWTRVDYSATSIAVGPDSVLIVTTRPHASPYGNVAAYGRLQCDTVSRAPAPCRATGWTELPFAAAQVALGDEPWVIDSEGTIQRLSAGRWQRVPGCARAITARGPHVWALSCGASNHPGGQEALQWTRGGWVSTGGYGQALAVDGRGSPWVVDAQGGIWHPRLPHMPVRPR